MDKLAWYDRLYIWTRVTFCGESKEKARQTNTCKFLRTLFLYLPFFICLFAVMIGFLITAVIAIIVAMFQATWTLDLILQILLGIVILVGAVVGVVVAGALITFLIGVIVHFWPKSNKVREPKMFRIHWNWPEWPFMTRLVKLIKDQHDKVCTKFEIGKEDPLT